jgi:IclR family transcriptional regulator, acetate operon repressor
MAGDGGDRNAVEKAIAVLESISEGREPRRLGDIANELGLRKPTVHRILQTFTRAGYVAAYADGVYGVGPRALRLGARFLDSDYRRVAEPILRDLHDRVGHTVHFAVRTGPIAVYVSKIEGDRPYQMASRIGMPISLHCTAMGKAILAELSEDDLRDALAGTPLVARTEHTLVTRSRLVAHLAEVRRQGYAIDDEENEMNVRCVGASVRHGLGSVLGAISVSALTFTLSMEEAHAMGPAIRQAADELSAALGAPSVDGAGTAAH